MGHAIVENRSAREYKYYDKFDDFKQTIDSIVGDTSGGSKEHIDKFIGESVQIFDTLIPINGNTFAANNGKNVIADIAA